MNLSTIFAVISSELTRVLHDDLSSGAVALRLDPAGGRAVIDGPSLRVDLTILPDRVAIAYAGDYHPVGRVALYLLDFLREGGLIPGPDVLSGAQRVDLADYRDGLTADDELDRLPAWV